MTYLDLYLAPLFLLANLLILGINVKLYSEIVKTSKLSQIAEK
jgi:hypothetical protein